MEVARLSSVTLSRGEQKERTRRALLDAALRLSAQAGLGSVSLRQLTKEVGVVPTAFYRHFDSVEDLGLELVHESVESLRAILREVRQDEPPPREIITRTVDTLFEHVVAHRDHFGFLVRERASGPARVRDAIQHQLELFERELAIDLARIPAPQWSSEDFQVLANMFVGVMVNNVTAVVNLQVGDPAEKTVRERTETQSRMIVVGALQWRSDYEATTASAARVGKDPER